MTQKPPPIELDATIITPGPDPIPLPSPNIGAGFGGLPSIPSFNQGHATTNRPFVITPGMVALPTYEQFKAFKKLNKQPGPLIYIMEAEKTQRAALEESFTLVTQSFPATFSTYVNGQLEANLPGGAENLASRLQREKNVVESALQSYRGQLPEQVAQANSFFGSDPIAKGRNDLIKAGLNSKSRPTDFEAARAASLNAAYTAKTTTFYIEHLNAHLAGIETAINNLVAQQQAEEAARVLAQQQAEEAARVLAQQQAEEAARVLAQQQAEEAARVLAQQQAEEAARVSLSNKPKKPHAFSLSNKPKKPHAFSLSNKPKKPHALSLSNKPKKPHAFSLSKRPKKRLVCRFK